jgi:hypothetical protein
MPFDPASSNVDVIIGSTRSFPHRELDPAPMGPVAG